jgi:hypothetical protein
LIRYNELREGGMDSKKIEWIQRRYNEFGEDAMDSGKNK